MSGPSQRAIPAAAGALAHRPGLWATALVTVGRLARPGWWHRRPFLPLPDGRLWAFRMETAYGRADADPLVEDVLAYLEWCRRGARPTVGTATRPGDGLTPDASGIGDRALRRREADRPG